MENIITREDIKEKLESIYDLERLVGKIIFGNENGKDMTALKHTIKSAIEICQILAQTSFFDDIDMQKLLKYIN